MSEFFPAGDASGLGLNQGKIVRFEGREFAIFNLNGQFYALDGLCPHRGGSLGAGTLEGDRLFCPMHGWEFEVKTGACVTNPARPVRRYSARVENGQIEIDLGPPT